MLQTVIIKKKAPIFVSEQEIDWDKSTRIQNTPVIVATMELDQV